MKIEKKTLQKEDGRSITFYHFPESATPEQTAAFIALDSKVETIAALQVNPNQAENDKNV